MLLVPVAPLPCMRRVWSGAQTEVPFAARTGALEGIGQKLFSRLETRHCDDDCWPFHRFADLVQAERPFFVAGHDARDHAAATRHSRVAKPARRNVQLAIPRPPEGKWRCAARSEDGTSAVRAPRQCDVSGQRSCAMDMSISGRGHLNTADQLADLQPGRTPSHAQKCRQAGHCTLAREEDLMHRPREGSRRDGGHRRATGKPVNPRLAEYST